MVLAVEGALGLIDEVRGRDYDRFLAIQLAPAAKRPALYAVTALTIELARIAEVVSEPLMGHIRLAWWREALEEITQGMTPRRHPLVLVLAELHTTHADIFPLLQRMVDARAADLDTSLIADEAGWLAYLDDTVGALHQVWARLLDVSAAKEHEAAIAAQARSYAIVAMVRAIPFMASQGWVRFPHAGMNAHGLTSLEPSGNMPDFVAELVAHAAPSSVSWPCSLKPLLALANLHGLHVRRLRRAGDDPYRLRPSKLRAVLVVLLTNIKKRS